MPPKIVYEDENVIIVDKPAGLPVHATGEKDKRETLVSFLLQHYPPIKGVGENSFRPGIVHRLDKETSGLTVIAKNNETFYELKEQFKQGKVEKKYIALVSGILAQDQGTIEMSLVKIGSKASSRFNAKLPVTSYGPEKPLGGLGPFAGLPVTKIKGAVTNYKVLKRHKEYTLVEVMPKTGRMHQIRVHFASINHPVACDKLYGRKSKKCPPGLARHFLHASYLKFRLKHALMEFESPLAGDLASTLDELAK